MNTEKFYLTGKYMYLPGIGFLGIVNFIVKDFAMTRPGPLPAFLEAANPAVAYISGALLLLCAVVLITKRLQVAAIIVIAALVLVLGEARHIYHKWNDPINASKCLVLLSGTGLVYLTIHPGVNTKRYLLWAAIICICLFFEICAHAHLMAAIYVQELIPKYIPARLFFTYFAGVCLALAGVGLLIPKIQKLAALLSGIQIAGWFILLHIPRAISLGNGTWIGVGESFALAGICFMVYGLLSRKKHA